jgi:hypothetical protein
LQQQQHGGVSNDFLVQSSDPQALLYNDRSPLENHHISNLSSSETDNTASNQILHDFQHGGVSNDFLVQSSDPLALLYNDRSPMENHHVSAGSRLMAKPVGHRVEDEVEALV